MAIGTEINMVARMAREHPDKTIVPLARSLCGAMYRTTPVGLRDNAIRKGECYLFPAVTRVAPLAVQVAPAVGVQLRKSFAVFSVADLLAWTLFFILFVIFIERVVLLRLERWVFRYRLRRGEDVLRY